MYAILETSGRQYKVQKDTKILVNRIDAGPKKTVKLDKILFAHTGKSYHIGNPYIKNAYVTCELLSQPRSRKVIAFKYKKRKSEKRKVGHRQDLTELVVKEIHV